MTFAPTICRAIVALLVLFGVSFPAWSDDETADMPLVREIAVLSDSPPVLLVATVRGLFQVNYAAPGDQRIEWHGLPGLPVRTLARVRTDPMEFLVGTGCCGLVRLTRKGGEWQLARIGTPGTVVRAVHRVPGGTAIFLSTERGLFRSTDDGATFQPAQQGFTGDRGLAFMQGRDARSTVYLFDQDYACHLWEEQKQCWVTYEELYEFSLLSSKSGPGWNTFYVNRAETPDLEYQMYGKFGGGRSVGLAFLGDGFLKGTPLSGVIRVRRQGTSTWRGEEIAFPGQRIFALRPGPGEGKSVYAATGTAMYISTDEGKSWKELGQLPTFSTK
jgi:hypothetical protein